MPINPVVGGGGGKATRIVIIDFGDVGIRGKGYWYPDYYIKGKRRRLQNIKQ